MTFLQDVAVNMAQLRDRANIEAVLDDVEYLYEVMPPEVQEYADLIVEQLRVRLGAASR